MHKDDVTQVLKIAKDTSHSGKGISLSEALKRTHYKELRKFLSETDIIPIIKANSQFIKDWQIYSEDKRTSSGYYLSNRAIGSIEFPENKYSYDSDEEAVAKYVILEMDYWSNLH